MVSWTWRGKSLPPKDMSLVGACGRDPEEARVDHARLFAGGGMWGAGMTGVARTLGVINRRPSILKRSTLVLRIVLNSLIGKSRVGIWRGGSRLVKRSQSKQVLED